MRKRKLGIIGGLVLVAALGGAALLLLSTDPSDDSSGNGSSSVEETSAAEIPLTSQEPNAVSSIDIQNASGSYEVVRVQEGDDENNAVYAISGWEDVPTDTSKLWTLSNNTATMAASAVVEEDCTDLEKFGLDEDTAALATLHFDDGSSYAFRIGNTASDSSLTYFAPAEEDTVYTIRTSLVSNFQNAAIDFLSKTILEAPAEDEYPIVNYLKIERKDMDYVFELDYDTTADDEDATGGTVASHIMVSPVPTYLSVDRSTPVVTGMFGLTADSVVVPMPTEADLEEYGLSDPFGTAIMDCDDGNQYVLHFSESYTQTDEETGTTGIYYYAYLEGVNAIYSVTEENMVWATVEPTDVASKLVLATYVWDIGTLDVSMPGGDSFAFKVTGESADDAQVTLNGEPTDAERYRTFYSFLLNITAETIDFTSEPTGESLADIRIETQNGSYAREFQFYALDDFTCLITVDGKAAYTCRRSFLDVLKNNMAIYDTDEKFTTNWS